MGVRLNKVLTELNIGLQTAVDFLKKKSSLGEIRDDATSNTKISDEQYEALVQAFSGDKAVKTQAEKLFTKIKKEKKAEKPATPPQVEEPSAAEQPRQQFKPLGKIDLDSLGKSKAKAAVAPEEKKEPEVTAEALAPVETKTPEPQPEVVEEVKEKPQPAKEEKVETSAPVEEQEETEPEDVDEPDYEDDEEEEAVEASAEANDGPEIFTLKSEAKLAPKVNVLGKIDLSTLNQSTRPKKKTKEEKRKQREEKAAQQRNPNGQPGEKKKRERIRTGRVDIEEAAKQQQQDQQGGKKKNKGGNQNFQDSNNQQGGGKKNKKNRPNIRPLEANEEDVARQVKETLARLTSKTTMNKKGAKYRKEKRVCDRIRVGNDDGRACGEGHRYLYVCGYHGVYQPASECRDHQPRC